MLSYERAIGIVPLQHHIFSLKISKANFLSGCIRQREVGSRLSNFRFSQAQSGSSNRQSACQQQFSKHNISLLSTSYFYIDAKDLLKVSISPIRICLKRPEQFAK